MNVMNVNVIVMWSIQKVIWTVDLFGVYIECIVLYFFIIWKKDKLFFYPGKASSTLYLLALLNLYYFLPDLISKCSETLEM